MTILIIVFVISTISLFLITSIRAWEIKTKRIDTSSIEKRSLLPKVYFRHIEKIMLYLTKHIVQWMVLIIVKYCFILQTKVKKWLQENSPKISKFFGKSTNSQPKKNTFLQRAILESKWKIRHMKERIIRENENKNR